MHKDKPDLYIHVGQATHFLRWELPEFAKYFNLVNQPSESATLLAFGPDMLSEAARLPARKRCIVLFPGFGHNPVHNLPLRKEHRRLIRNSYDIAFINPGPLEIAYDGLKNIVLYPFSIDTSLLRRHKPRNKVKKIIHISNDSPQKDWQRSERVMNLIGLPYEIFPPRNPEYFNKIFKVNKLKNNIRKLIGQKNKKYLPYGYVSHEKIVRKYYEADAFVHIAAEVRDELYLDGKYTATLIEAGVSGCIIFWHDTFRLGNGLETVFSVSADEKLAARQIQGILNDLDVKKHSEATRKEFLSTFNVESSVKARALAILDITGQISL